MPMCQYSMTAVSSGVKDLSVDDSTTNIDFDALIQLAAHQDGDTLQFYELEGQILALWDKLNELQLEIAVLQAQKADSTEDTSSLSEDEVSKELKKAEKECLDARAEYVLSGSVIEDTIITGPILNAIHAGENASGPERTLKPLIERRDTLEMASTNLSSLLQSTIEKKTGIEIVCDSIKQKNRGVAADLVPLAKKIEERRTVVNKEPHLEAKVVEAKEEADTARKQRVIMKSVVSAVIAGSGVNWSKDSGLRDLVLKVDDEDD
ncbi:uncharacterized protein KY384_000753 [Bacidia gigantensis]|uniref:uncharacterized protein n=1 Tax=Bacidia gigantensis TaxID=2732470 RepID=UPI001D038A87|nr:uncharacterized protein KY384_000753 [Bacidia gigantensis]KAG8525991.1 hypothetical protein KY384_000753 [Bacidia gigantensis]